MGDAGEIRTLKSSLARSVRLEYPARVRTGDGAPEPARPRVIKRFASRGLLAAPRDAAGARREFALLEYLHAAGLPVPRPLSIERRSGGWEVAMQWIPQAHTLQELLLAGETRDLPAQALGALLARLQASGIDHPDLHPGNVLIDAGGGVWAIDFHKARRVSRLPVSRMEGQLAHLVAGLRERTTARFRARCLLAWLRALPADHARPPGTTAELARRLEARARRERVPTVERRRLRWTRPGTAVRPVSLAGGDGFERSDAPEGLARALEAGLEREGSGGARVLLPWPGVQPRRVLALRGARRAVSAAWYAAARLEEHDLPAARPLVIAGGKSCWAAFELPAEGHLLESWGALSGARRLRALGALVALLHDRGLALARLAPEFLWIGADDSVSIAGVPRLVAAISSAPDSRLEPWCAVLGADSLQRAELAAGFLATLDCAGEERARLSLALARD